MITHFAVLEADFQREYRIDLVREVWTMTWRRFVVLLNGLSLGSTWKLIGRAEHRGNNREGVRRLSDPDEIEAYFSGIGR